jgi:hypothetical protein
LLVLAVGCRATPPRDDPRPPAPKPALVAEAPPSASLAEPSSVPSLATPPPPPKPSVSAAVAEQVLYLGQTPSTVTAACAGKADEARIRCLLTERYAADPAAQKLALALYDHSGDVAGLEPKQLFDGGYRGIIELVPELPVGKWRKHLAWVEEGTRDFDQVYVALELAAAAAGKTPRYRWKALTLKFFRSVDRTTPNGFANGWSYAYNVAGSLLHSAVAVRELMVHEIFHLNDGAHGDWSSSALAAAQKEAIQKCGTKIACLTPYAPNDTIVKNGTYYAFQPGNGPWEYAAELAVRHYREHRAVLGKEKLPGKPWKCGPAPNGAAWKAFVDEFWGGLDLTPAC